MTQKPLLCTPSVQLKQSSMSIFHDNPEEIRRLEARVDELHGALETQAEFYENRIERLKIRRKEELDRLKAELKPDFAQEREDLLTSLQSTIDTAVSTAIDGLRQCKISNNESSSELETFAGSKGSTASEHLPTALIAKQGSKPQVAAALPKDAELAVTRDQPKVSTIPSFQSFASLPQTSVRSSGFGSFGLSQWPGAAFNHPAKSPSQFPTLGSSKPKLDVRTGEGESQQLKHKGDNPGSDKGKQLTTQPKVHEPPRAQSPNLVSTSAIGSKVYATGSQPVNTTLLADNNTKPTTAKLPQHSGRTTPRALFETPDEMEERLKAEALAKMKIQQEPNPVIVSSLADKDTEPTTAKLPQRSESIIPRVHLDMETPEEFIKRLEAEKQAKKEAQSVESKSAAVSLPADNDKKPLSRFWEQSPRTERPEKRLKRIEAENQAKENARSVESKSVAVSLPSDDE